MKANVCTFFKACLAFAPLRLEDFLAKNLTSRRQVARTKLFF